MLMPLTGYPVALVSGYILSLVVNYFLTVRWTFKSKANAKNAVGIVAAHLFNLFVVRMGLMYLWVNGCKLPERTAYLPTLAISVVANFIIIKLIIVKLNSHEKSIHTNSLL
jgi:putative flippase GtrA